MHDFRLQAQQQLTKGQWDGTRTLRMVAVSIVARIETNIGNRLSSNITAVILSVTGHTLA